MATVLDSRINFNNPNVSKPSNLQNSAVLRMLEEEEHRQRTGQSPSDLYRPLKEQITWPPPEYDIRSQQRASFKDVVTPGLKRVAWPPPHEGEIYTEPNQNQGGRQNSSPQSGGRAPLRPLDIANGGVGNPHHHQQQASSSGSPSLGNQSPVGFRPATPSRGWAPVHSPVGNQQAQPQFYRPQQVQPQYQPGQQVQPQYQQAQPQYQPTQQAQPQYQPSLQQYQPVQPQYQPSQQQYQPALQQYQPLQQQYQPIQQSQPQYQSPQPHQQYPSQTQQVPVQQYQQPAVRQVEPPPTTITLRQQAPVSQAPPPVVTSQPATATLKGGKHLRGDLKWPPEPVRARMDAEQQQLMALAQGPACKPRLIRKDYGPFFAQHALNDNYPGYKIPPGTQFYEHTPRLH